LKRSSHSDATFNDPDGGDLDGGNLTVLYSSGGGAEDQLLIKEQVQGRLASAALMSATKALLSAQYTQPTTVLTVRVYRSISTATPVLRLWTH